MRLLRTKIRKYYKYQYSSWTQPTLTSEVTKVNEGCISCVSKGEYADGSTIEASHYVMDGIKSGTTLGTFWSSKSNPSYWRVTYPYLIKITAVKVYNRYQTVGAAAVTCNAYTDTKKSQRIGSEFVVPAGNWSSINIPDIPASGIITDTLYIETNGQGLGEIEITATKVTVIESTSIDYDFYKDEIVYYVVPKTQDNTNVITSFPNHIKIEKTDATVTYYGSITTNINGTTSGFSTSKYMKASKSAPSSITSFEEVLKIRVTNVTTLQTFVAGDPYLGLGTIKVTAAGKIQTYISSTGSSNDISNGTTSSNGVSIDTDYYVKFHWNGSVYKIDLSTDGTNYTNYISITSSLPPKFNGLTGLGTDTGASNNEPFLGSIYVNDCYININGQRFWTGNVGKLTLKSGSKVFVPSGFNGSTPIFNELTITSDKSAVLGDNTVRPFFCNSSGGLAAYMKHTSGTGPTTTSGNEMVYRTDTNVMELYVNGALHSSGFSLPFSYVEGTHSILDVYNSLGYIGSTIFILPNVKGNIPNGRNNDKSNKVIKAVTNGVKIYTYPNTWTRTNQPIFLTSNGFEPHSTADSRYYDNKNTLVQDSLTYVTYFDNVQNKVYHSSETAGSYSQVYQTIMGYCTLTEGVISNLRHISLKPEYITFYTAFD